MFRPLRRFTSLFATLCVAAFCTQGPARAAEPAAPTAMEATRLLFDLATQPGLVLPGGPASIDTANRTVTLPGSEREYNASIDAGGNTPPRFRRGKSLTLRADLLEGDGAGLAVCFADEAGMEFATGNLALKPGPNALVWQVPEKPDYRWGAATDGTVRGAVRVTRVIVVRWPHPSTARVRLDGIDVLERLTQTDGVRVDLKPDQPLAAAAPGSAEARLELANTRDAEVRLAWKLAIIAADGSRTESAQDLVLAPKATLAIPVPASATAREGIVRLEWELRDAGDTRRGEQRLAVMRWAGPDARFRDHFMFGCGGPDHKERNALILQQLGMDILRVSDNWTYGSQAPGVHDWSKELKEARLCRDLGMELNWLTAYSPSWGLLPGTKPSWHGWNNARPPTPEAWRAYMQQLGAQTKDLATTYEIWNEADWGFFFSGTAEHYLEMLRVAHEELRKANPAAKLISSGMAGDCGNYEFQKRVASEGKDWLDYYGWHQHGNFREHFQPSVDGRVAECTRLAGKPVFYTETSEQSHGHWDGEVAQGATLIKKVVHAWGRGARGYQWFVLMDGDETWGLLHRDYAVKPSFLAYNTLVRTLRGLRPQRTLDLGFDRWAWVFADTTGTRQVVVHWKENERIPEADFRLQVGADATVAVRDLFGHDTGEPVVGGQIRIQPRDVPVFVLLDKAPTLTAALPLVVPEQPAGIAAGAPFDLAATVGNPGDRARRMTLTAALPAELGLPRPAPATLELGKDAQSRQASPLTVPADAKLPFGAFAGALAYDLPGAWKGTLTVPLETVRLIPAGPIGDRPPDFVLAAKSDVINAFDNDPIAKAKHWQGPADLSAKVWVAHHDGALRLRVEVADDRHDNPHGGGDDSWKGDGLQVAFDAPGRQGYWEAGIWLHGDQGKRHIFRAIEGLPNPWEKIQVQVARRDGGLTYDVAFPLADFGLTPEALAKGIQINLVVNDSDGDGRRQYARIAPGIADDKTLRFAPKIRFAGRASGEPAQKWGEVGRVQPGNASCR